MYAELVLYVLLASHIPSLRVPPACPFPLLVPGQDVRVCVCVSRQGGRGRRGGGRSVLVDVLHLVGRLLAAAQRSQEVAQLP